MSHKGQLSETTRTIIELSKRPEGVTVDDLPEGTKHRTLWKIAFARHVFTLKTGSKRFVRRYFDTQERADCYYASNPLPKKVARKKAQPKTGAEMLKAAIPGKLTVKQLTGGPARLPGIPLITPQTKITIAPPPPAVMYHSNTHAR